MRCAFVRFSHAGIAQSALNDGRTAVASGQLPPLGGRAPIIAQAITPESRPSERLLFRPADRSAGMSEDAVRRALGQHAAHVVGITLGARSLPAPRTRR
jgi:hypothetical protein